MLRQGGGAKRKKILFFGYFSDCSTVRVHSVGRNLWTIKFMAEQFNLFEEKMRAAGVVEAAIEAFRASYRALAANESGLIGEAEIEPVVGVPSLEELSRENETFDPELLDQTVVIKLNGGLGTSMGLQAAKSLLRVKGDKTFLDLIVQQMRYLHEATGAQPRFLLMNSFSTSDDTIDYLQRHARSGFDRREDVEMLQNQVPKVDAESLQPVSWPANPSLEWCPPGHGDLYAALVGSGWLERLLGAGVKYAFVSNADNLGATLHPSLLRYFAESECPFMMEVTRRTLSDRKGGHLALRKSDDQLILREVAQCAEEDLAQFQDVDRHQFFNTNSLWIRLDVLQDLVSEHGGYLPLPMIKNRKTVDPRDADSLPVYQLETAMGAAIERFAGAAAVSVPRDRFAPVKTTSDLLALRSDAYQQGADGKVALVYSRNGQPPVVELDARHYKLVDGLDELGTPSLVAAGRLTVKGLVRFAPGVVIEGEVTVENDEDSVKVLAAGHYRDRTIKL